MKSKNLMAFVISAALLTCTMLSAPAMAQTDNGFSALQGVEAQALSSREMDAISGELNAYDIAAALNATAAKLGAYPRLQAAAVKLAGYYFNNATKINAAFAKLGILTSCKSCPQ